MHAVDRRPSAWKISKKFQTRAAWEIQNRAITRSPNQVQASNNLLAGPISCSLRLFDISWMYVHFAAADFGLIDIDFAFGRAGDHPTGVDVEL